MEILPATDDSGVAKPQRFLLHFPTLSVDDLTKQLASSTSSVLLNIGGYQVIREIHGRMGMPAQWSRLDEPLEERLQIKEKSPLIIEFTDLRGLVTSDYPGHTDIVLSIQLGHTFPDGTYEANLYGLSFPVSGGSGNYPVRTITRQGEECLHYRIDPALIQTADH
jgi:hypothetical protein